MAKTQDIEPSISGGDQLNCKSEAFNGKAAISAVATDPASKPAVKAGSSGDSDCAEDATSIRRLWFVRMPKPPEIISLKPLEVEIETYKAQVRLLSESVNVKKLERDAARANVRAAREAMKACREAYNAKFAEVEPLREALRSGGAVSRRLREEFDGLDASTEAELDAKIAALNHRIEHESIPLKEEKAIMTNIRKLEAQRGKVLDYQATMGAATEARAAVDHLRAESADHEAELKVLRAEKDTQSAILAKYLEQEAVVVAETEAAWEERNRVKELQDAAFSKLAETRRAQRDRGEGHFANRRFSRTVRKAVAEGRLDEAIAMCNEQMDEAHAKIASDADFRSEYLSMWEHQHAVAASDVDVFDEDKTLNGDSDLAKPHRPQKPEVPAMEPAVKAQAVIAAVLKEAKAEAPNRKAEGAPLVPIIAHATTSAAGDSATIDRGDTVHAVKPLTALVGGAKKTGAPAYVVEPVVVPDDTFELPDVFKHKRVSSAGERQTAPEKAAERERNRQAQEEAEQRRLRREREKTRRKERALRAQAEEESRDAGAVAGAASRAEAGNEATGTAPVTTGTDDDMNMNVQPPKLQKGQKQTKAPLPVVKALASKPVAKRLVRRPTLQSQLLLAIESKEVQVVLAVAVAALVLLALRIFASGNDMASFGNDW